MHTGHNMCDGRFFRRHRLPKITAAWTSKDQGLAGYRPGPPAKAVGPGRRPRPWACGGKGHEWPGHGVAMGVWWPRGGHVVAMWWLCRGYVVAMWWPCGGHAVAMWWPGGHEAKAMWWPCGHQAMKPGGHVAIHYTSLNHLKSG